MTDRLLLRLVLLFVALNGADLVLTNYLLQSGRGVEGNPVAALFVGSLLVFLAVKILYPSFVGWRVLRHPSRAAVNLLVGWTGVFVLVVAWNLHVAVVRS